MTRRRLMNELNRIGVSLTEQCSYCIAILEQEGKAIDWVDIEYYGPFTSKEEARRWAALEENKPVVGQRYTFEYLRNP